jgi:hypothetical protein
MNAFFAGAGFSKWGANLPLARELFDFQVQPFGPREAERLAEVRDAKDQWHAFHPHEPAEAFIHFAITGSERSRRRVIWYIARRLSEPYIWHEWHAWRWRRHVLMIDEHRALERPGVRVVRDFLSVMLERGITGILTSNYDMLLEYSLGTKDFNYGIPGERLSGRGPYPVSQWANPVILSGRTSIAKLHGSISWDRHGRYTDGRRAITGDALIVAPTPDKVPPPDLRQEWDLAADILRGSARLLVFGFGFNQYDTALLDHLGRHGRGLREVLLVDVAPNESAARAVWPNAQIASTGPPAEGISAIRGWLHSPPKQA